MELQEHEDKSQHRYEKVMGAIHETTKERDMTTQPMIIEGGMGGAGAGLGAGLGGGLLGGILGGALLGNNGILGNRGVGVGNVEGIVTPTQLTAALAGVQDQNSFSALMQGQARLEGLIPTAEGALQLALAQSQGQVMNQIGQQSLAIAQGFGNSAQQVSTAQAAVIAVGESIKDTVNSTSAATQLGIANLATSGLQNTFALSQAISNDGEKTRALITSINDANLNRQLTVADLDRRDEANRARSREVEVNVSQTVTQNQNNLQAQAQSQNQFQILAQLAAGINNLAGDIQAVRQTQSNVVFGNQTGSNQTASAANNRVS